MAPKKQTEYQSRYDSMNPILIDVAEYAGTEEMRAELRACSAIRVRALEICYNIPEYRTASLETKNMVYDAVRNLLFAVSDSPVSDSPVSDASDSPVSDASDAGDLAS